MHKNGQNWVLPIKITRKKILILGTILIKNSVYSVACTVRERLGDTVKVRGWKGFLCSFWNVSTFLTTPGHSWRICKFLNFPSYSFLLVPYSRVPNKRGDVFFLKDFRPPPLRTLFAPPRLLVFWIWNIKNAVFCKFVQFSGIFWPPGSYLHPPLLINLI